jgi:hypothetical protein
MSTYTRQPQKTLAKCRVPDCKWMRIYWDDPTKMNHAVRAAHGLNTHVARAHRVKVLINGR